MKQKLNNILGNPKRVVAITAIISLFIGIGSYVIHKNTLAELFAHINDLQADTITTNSTTAQKNLTLAFPLGGRIKNVSVKIGDKVKAGAVLASLDSENALGAVNQAKAAYSAAQTAYDKLVNGASTPDIDVAKVALNNARNAYTNAVTQQKVLVANAYSTMLSSGLVAISTTNDASTSGAPIITGTYTSTEKGVYTVSLYGTGAGGYFSISGLESGSGPVSSTPVPLGTRGLYIQFPNSNPTATSWTISIPNTQSPSYLVNQNAYQSALQSQSQAITTAQGAVDAAQAALDQKIAGARIEDLQIARAQVESTKGALQIAQGAYNNTIITAPVDGTITNVMITAGQITTLNTPAIELLAQ